jgi:hypothetical protein
MSNQKKLASSEEVRAPAQSPYLVTKDELILIFTDSGTTA